MRCYSWWVLKKHRAASKATKKAKATSTLNSKKSKITRWISRKLKSRARTRRANRPFQQKMTPSLYRTIGTLIPYYY
jgi:hypothetical protein